MIKLDKDSIVASILSVNDGLNSNLCLILFVAGTNISKHIIILTGIAGMISGALSMAFGEWQAVDVIEGSPFEAAFAAFLSFIIGAFIPIIPFYWFIGMRAVVISIIGSAITLFLIGFFDAGKKPKLINGIRQVILGITAAIAIYFLGQFLGVQI